MKRVIVPAAMFVVVAGTCYGTVLDELACQSFLDGRPEGFYEVPHPSGGLNQVWVRHHELHRLTDFTEQPMAVDYNIFYQNDYSNGSCYTSSHEIKFSFEKIDSWETSGYVEGSAGAEAEAGVVLARAKTTASVTVNVGGGLSGSKSITITDTSTYTASPCSIWRFRGYTKNGGGVATGEYAEAVVYHECVAGGCEGAADWEETCGASTIEAEVWARLFTADPPDSGWQKIRDIEGGCGCDGDGGGNGGGLTCGDLEAQYIVSDSTASVQIHEVTVSQEIFDDLIAAGCDVSWIDYVSDDAGRVTSVESLINVQ